jgi:mRNA-degrading endonuclease HigB of HigAB toxin-antitoxin module
MKNTQTVYIKRYANSKPKEGWKSYTNHRQSRLCKSHFIMINGSVQKKRIVFNIYGSNKKALEYVKFKLR